MPTLLTPAETAKVLRISVRTLERYRNEGVGPRYVKVGRRVLYRENDIADWLEAHAVSNTAEAEA